MNELAAKVSAPALADTAACANCGTVTNGNYCGRCGQRLDIQLHSLGYFLGEATEVLTHADARLWRTLWPLLTRPGFLTREYFAGRRARYLQPFRLYLILSIVFFLLSAMLSNHEEAIVPHAGLDAEQRCQNLNIDLPGEQWLRPRFTVACRQMAADGGRAFGNSVVQNLGRGMFVFLPLLAALMKLFYWRPRRFYLEHLLLLIHNHAFAFLLLSIFLLATHWMSALGWRTLFTLAMTWYLARYLYRSMKLMYGQSGWLTFLKFNVLGLAYLICGLIMLIGAVFFSAVIV